MDEDPFITELLRVAERNMRASSSPASAVPMSLVAAGGWCAPSYPVWDDFAFAKAAGLLDLPTFSIRRGGVTWPTGIKARPLPKFENCPSFGPPLGMLKPLELGLFI